MYRPAERCVALLLHTAITVMIWELYRPTIVQTTENRRPASRSQLLTMLPFLHVQQDITMCSPRPWRPANSHQLATRLRQNLQSADVMMLERGSAVRLRVETSALYASKPLGGRATGDCCSTLICHGTCCCLL